ncbi:DUF5009 domain-containing protein [Haloferula sp. BvORR071]|uniref:DUF5009 domain-containing protein n=1 Tax=Haloferula sp. BvORR071 TaxID=1396141 RepID=UPI0005514AE4|nr:DUF5009 domain-containing protein [Haloferula sp. BvORR071]
MTTVAPPADGSPAVPAVQAKAQRITSIDALRGFVMFTMIFVNDLAGAPRHLVPDWMVHYSDRHRGGSGMTLVDLVFPAFIFIVGMSIPFALGSRLAKGEALWKIVLHILGRTLALLAIGIVMVNELPDAGNLGWSPSLWAVLMFGSAILAFSSLTPPSGLSVSPRPRFWKVLNLVIRSIGYAGLIWLAFAWRGNEAENRIITLTPFHINRDWYGILGLIAWAYLAAALIFLVFRGRRTALLGCVALMTCFYAADRKGFFEDFWPNQYVDFGSTLGAQAAIAVAGLLLASILVAADMKQHRTRIGFTLLFIAGFAAAAMLTKGLYGISKNAATPAWCLWASAITAALWLLFYLVCDVARAGVVAKPLAVAGQNVLLAYLISEMLPSLLPLLHLDDWYGHLGEASLGAAVGRSIGCSVVILAVTALLNRLGFRLKL